MRKFLLKVLFLTVIALNTLQVFGTSKKQFVFVPNAQDECRLASISSWKLADFPFMGILQQRSFSPSSLLIVDQITWAATMMEIGNVFTCDDPTPFHIEIDVTKVGATDITSGAAVTDLECRVIISRVSTFGGVQTCTYEEDMTYFADNDPADTYIADINLEPGLYEITCNCSDDGYAAPPVNVLDIATSVPANAFTYMQVTVGGAVANDDCDDANAVVVLNAVDQPVENECTSDGKAWFKYVVTNGDEITITVGNTGTSTLANPEIYQVLLNPIAAPVGCGGVDVGTNPTCLQVGDILYIEAGKEDNGLNPPNTCPDFGTFVISVSDDDNGIVNDACGDAIDLGDLICGTTVTGAGNPGACPDLEAVCGSTTDPGVWYTFTVDVSVPEFSLTGSDFELFTGDNCTALAPIGCTGDAAVSGIITNTALTYRVLVFNSGSFTATPDFSIPANDDCGSATTLAGTLPGQSNICADSETANNCPSNEDNVVWYSFTMPAGNENATITITGTGTTPIANPTMSVFGGNCGAPLLEDFVCGNTLSLTCLTPGTTYLIHLGSGVADAGTFDISIVFSDNGVANDVCADATTLSITNDCMFHPVTTTSTDACPETLDLACNGGNYNADPTVWLEFTPPAGVTSINIRNITPAGAYLTILDNCTATTPIAGGACLFGAGPTADINVTAGTTYFIMTAIAGGSGAIDFEIKYNDRPDNDECADAIAVAVGANAGTNVCASEDLTPCGGTSDEASVWYSFTIPAGVKSLEIATSLTGGVVQVYEADCATVLTGSITGACTATYTIECPEPQDIRIYTSSSTANTGAFTLTLTQTLQTGIDQCSDAQVLALTEPLCKDPNDFASDNTDFCPEPSSLNFGGCDFSGGPATWYTFTTSANTDFVDIEITGLATNFGLFTDCNGASVASSCTTDGTLIDLPVSASTTYFLVVSGTTGAEGPFTINITEKSNPPSNDDCTGAIGVTVGANANLTNLCATDDLTPCGGTADEASVWYSYTIPVGVATLVINTDLTGGVVQVYEDDCSTVLIPSMGACTNTITLDCPAAQDIRIYVSSSSANSNIFTLTLTETATTAPNDLCANAQDIADTPICEFFAVTSTTTVGACPEEDMVSGCAFDYSVEAVVWYSFTPPSNTVSIEIENIIANATLTVFESCPTPTFGTIPAGGSCLTGAGTNGTPILVTAGNTYFIAIGLSGTTGNVGFEIKYNLGIPNDDPCMAGFVISPLTDGTPLTGEDNSCATDDNDCGGATVENTLWYSFTLVAPMDRITINVTGLTSPSIAIYDVANPCGQAALNEECSGDGMVDFNCLPAGDYSIMIGSSAANAGIFTVTATSGTNNGPVNDYCDMATPIVIGPTDLCIELGPFSASTVNACPETLPAGQIFGACDFNTEETSWYTFTAPGVAGDMPTMDFTFESYTGSGTPFMNLFNFGADCSNLTAVEANCYQGLGIVFGGIGPLTPGSVYLIAISSTGDTGGNMDFTVKFNLGPLNDDKCADLSAFDLGSGGTLNDQTNLCAGGDYDILGCPAADSENSVWYTFTVDPGSYGISIFIDAINTNGTPIQNPVAAGVYIDGCTSDELITSLCFPIKTEDLVLDCLEPGVYSLQISTSTIHSGDFFITTAQLIDNRACPAGDLLDLCVDALDIPLAGVFCSPVPVSSCNTNACPENLNIGCIYDSEPTVWFKFTVDPGAASIDITEMTGGFSYGLLEGDPCTDASISTLSGFECMTAANSLNISVTGGNTYYMVVSNANDGGFSFNIIQNVFPENDDPNPSSPRPPYVLGLNDSHNGGTCCALGFNDDPNLDEANVACSGDSNDGAVWYRYTTGTEVGFEVTIEPSGPNPISGPVAIEILSGTTTAPGSALFNPTSFSCGAAPVTLKVGCFEPGEEVWIKVASSNANCGSFTIVIKEINQCPLAEECVDIMNIIGPTVTDPNCGNFQTFQADGCIEAACQQTDITSCGAANFPTVWFQVEVDDDAVQLNSSIVTSGGWQPIWAFYTGDCGSLVIDSGGTIDEPTDCSNGDSNPDIHSVGVDEGVTTYYIAVSGEGVIDDPNFSVTVWTTAGCVACIGEDGCNPQAEWSITSRSSDRPLDDPFFCQGEDVTVCVDYLYDASETGVDWFHGLIPDFGPGWDMNAFDPTSVTVSPGNPEWNDQDDGGCAPFITEQMPYLCTYTDPQTGRLKLCHTGCQTCPCAGPLPANSPLPSGWFWSTNGGGGCANDCSPSTQYGIGSVVVQINFCVDLKVRVFDNEADCEANRSLKFNFQTTSDGVSGCWNDPVAECKLDFAQIGPPWRIDCNRPPKIEADDVEFCKEDFVNMLLTNEDGNGSVEIDVTFIDNPNVIGENNHYFTGGSGIINDYLINTGNNIEEVFYLATSILPGFICPSPQDTFKVTIYPDVIVEFDNYIFCPESALPAELIPNVSGGSGNYIGTTIPFVNGYLWNNGETTSSIIVNPQSTTAYTVTVTDDKGCFGSGEVEVEVKDPVTFDLQPLELSLCGGFDEYEVSVENVIANSPTYQVSWNIPFGLTAAPGGVPAGSKLYITPALSNPTFSPYTVSATVTDNFGCQTFRDMVVNIGEAPQAELAYTPLVCNGPTLTDISIQNLYNPSGFDVIYTLLDCDGNIASGDFGNYVIYNEFDFFFGVDVSLNNCFKLQMVTVDASGNELCEIIIEPALIIPIPMAVPVVVSPAQSICAGASANIAVTNAATYTSFAWLPAGTSTTATATVMPSATTQYSVTATQSNGCTSVGSVTITVNDSPTAGISGSTTYCAGDNTVLTASGGNSYLWAGPGGFNANTASTGPINTDGIYTVTVTDVNGCTDTNEETIAESTVLNVIIDSISICDNMVDSLDAGNGFDTYAWSDASGNPLATTQKLGVSAAGTYTVSVTNGSCSGTGMGVVLNFTTPMVALPDTMDVCRLVTGIGPNYVNFDSIASVTIGTWFNIDNAPVSTSDWANVNFTTVPTRDTFRFEYITNTAEAPCLDIRDTLVIVVRNCPCPNPSINFADYCNSRTSPVDLNGNWIGAVNPGTWTVVAGTQPYPVISNDSLVVLNAMAGTYILRYTYDVQIGACPASIDVPVTIEQASAVTGMNVTLCNQPSASGPNTVDINTLLSGLVEPTPGSWVDDAGNPVTNTVIDATGMSVDTLKFTYTTTSTLPCTPRTVTVEVRVRDCSCPIVTLVRDTLCNGSMDLADLEDPSKFMVDPAGTTGVWTIGAPNSIVNDHFINPFGITASTLGAPYVATFTLDGTYPANCTTVFTKNIAIRNQPKVEVSKDGVACSANTDNGPTSVSLPSLLVPGYTIGGTWTQVSPATPMLTITNGNVDFTGTTIGEEFVFRYSVTALAPCLPVTEDVKVVVQDCNCPDGNIACQALPDCNLCNSGDLLDLTTLIVNPASFASGTWTVTGPLNANISLNGGTILDAKDLPAGTYKIKYTLDPAPGGACPPSQEISIKISDFAQAEIISDTTVCIGTNGNPLLNLSGLVISGIGAWADEDGTPVTAAINFSTYTAGTVLTYTFTLGNSAPCPPDKQTLTVTITDNCNCPPIVLGAIPSVCTNNATFDLKPYSDTDNAGTWSSTDPAIVINNGIITLTGVTAGIYPLIYTLSNPVAGCPSTKSTMVTVFNPKSAGTARGAEFCFGATDNVSLFDRLDNEDAGGVWKDVNGITIANGMFSVTGKAVGTYRFTYSFTNQSPCPDDSEEVVITINPIPVADAGLDKNLDCENQSDLLGTNNSSAGSNIVYEWKLNNDIIASTINYTATMGGTYTLTVMDTVTNCSASDIVIVNQADDLPLFDIRVDTIACFGQTATITLSNLRGGKTPYEISFDGGVTYGTALSLANLKNGTYKVQVKDANGCVNDQLPAITITEPALFTLNLGQDFFLNINEDSLLTIAGQYNPQTAQSVTWKANGIELTAAANQATLLAAPLEDTEYTVTVVNESGCIATDNIRITIKRVKPECVPNIFSPNDKEVNNFFSINCEEVEMVTKYRIYDRWGNLLFVGEDLLPSQPQTFWDGNFKQKPVVPGVYVYYIEMLFKDGSTEKRGGDVTVIR